MTWAERQVSIMQMESATFYRVARSMAEQGNDKAAIHAQERAALRSWMAMEGLLTIMAANKERIEW